MTSRRDSLLAGLGLALLRPVHAAAEERVLELDLTLRDHEDRPLHAGP